jgi:hypothetical protein
LGWDEILPYLNPNVNSMGELSGKGSSAMRLGKHADNVRIQVQQHQGNFIPRTPHHNIHSSPITLRALALLRRHRRSLKSISNARNNSPNNKLHKFVRTRLQYRTSNHNRRPKEYRTSSSKRIA